MKKKQLILISRKVSKNNIDICRNAEILIH